MFSNLQSRVLFWAPSAEVQFITWVLWWKIALNDPLMHIFSIVRDIQLHLFN